MGGGLGGNASQQSGRVWCTQHTQQATAGICGQCNACQTQAHTCCPVGCLLVSICSCKRCSCLFMLANKLVYKSCVGSCRLVHGVQHGERQGTEQSSAANRV